MPYDKKEAKKSTPKKADKKPTKKVSPRSMHRGRSK